MVTQRERRLTKEAKVAKPTKEMKSDEQRKKEKEREMRQRLNHETNILFQIKTRLTMISNIDFCRIAC